MLRPATPLTLILFVAFVLLLLATISTPIVKAIPLASVNGVNLGVFGYCTPTGCSKIQIGYSVDAKTLFGNSNDNSDFSLPSTTRSSLSAILIVHPIAALLVLVCLIMSAVAHFHSPSHSTRYLIAILIFSIPTLLVTLLAFLVDLLLFVPHLAWGGWIVLASTILLLAGGIVTCAMRRTLVSRKERKRRIAENAEMSGENFYANQNPVPQGIRADSPPPLPPGGMPESDKLPAFAAYEKKASGEEDRVPLNQRSPSNKQPPGAFAVPERFDRRPPPSRGGGYPMRGGRGGHGGARDEYGNPLPPSDAFGPAPPMGMRRDRSEPPMRRQYSDEADGGYGRGYGPPRGGGRSRGGYPPRGYGRGGPHGGRGGYGRGPPGPPMNRGGPPPGYGNGYGGPPPGRPGMYDGPSPPPGAFYGRSPSAPGYGRNQMPPGPPPFNQGGFGRGPSPGPPPLGQTGFARGPSPASPRRPTDYDRDPFPAPGTTYNGQPVYGQAPVQPYQPEPPSPLQPTSHSGDPGTIGQAIEMDARHGSPSDTAPPPLPGPNDGNGHMSVTSVYSSNEAYVPPRAGWKATPSNLGREPSSPTTNHIPADPVELPVSNTLRKPVGSPPQAHARKQSSDEYYEDVAPRFAPASPTQPAELTAGLPQAHAAEIIDELDVVTPQSEGSNMTSISQRGVNPKWAPGAPPVTQHGQAF